MANNKRIQTLKSPEDFQRLRDQGTSVGVTKWLSLSFLQNGAGALRIGWTYPNYVGSAVLRNRFKRWSREFMQKKLAAGVAERAFDVNIFLRRRNEDFYKTVTHEVFDGTLQHAFDKFETFRERAAPANRAEAH